MKCSSERSLGENLFLDLLERVRGGGLWVDKLLEIGPNRVNILIRSLVGL